MFAGADGEETVGRPWIGFLTLWHLGELGDAAVTGEVFEVHAGHLGIIELPRRGNHIDNDRR